MRALENADRIRQALAPPDREPSGSKSGMAAALWLRTTVKAPAGVADGGHRLSLRVGEDGSRSALPDQRKPIGWMMRSSEDFGAALAGLERASRHRLTEHWVGCFGAAPPPRTSRSLMIRAIAYTRAQERAIGGLSAATRRLLCAEEPAPVRRRRGLRAARHRADPGMARHRPSNTIVEKGVIYRGEHHRSLSEVARLITGARWSGAAVLRGEAMTAEPPARRCAVYTRKSSRGRVGAGLQLAARAARGLPEGFHPQPEERGMAAADRDRWP